MTWDFAQGILIIGDKIHQLIPGEGCGFFRRVVATEKVTIPPRSQAIVPGRVEMSRMQGGSDGGVWTTKVSELRNGVNVARAILPERLVLNSSTEPCEINADTILTELTLAKCAEEYDENELTVEEGDRSYKHLSKLMEGDDERVSEEQRVELIKILREYSDVFSTGKLDLGETSLATHHSNGFGS